VTLSAIVGHPEHFQHMMGMDKHIFRALVTVLSQTSDLCAGKYVSADEKVAIFL
jgi:hypothetical protein